MSVKVTIEVPADAAYKAKVEYSDPYPPRLDTFAGFVPPGISATFEPDPSRKVTVSEVPLDEQAPAPGN